ncbi:MAG: hypothetical protein ACU0BC_08775 [Pseudooceanicola nanhaiensis]
MAEDRVRAALEPYHARLRSVVELGYQECLEVKRFRAENGFGPLMYMRTEANDVFDAVVRNAIREFSDDSDVRIIEEAQTAKFCFSETVLVRFKKGDELHLGRNLMTQAVMDFVSVQGTLPGLPPAAAKVEVLYSATELGDGIDRVLVVARDGDDLLWHYDLDRAPNATTVVPLLRAAQEQPENEEEVLVKPRLRKEDSGTRDSKGE